MVDTNYDNVSDNLCTTPDYINEYPRTIPNIVKDIFLPQISLNIINNSIYNTNDKPISFSSSEKINIQVSDNSEPWVGANNTIHLNDGLHKLRLKISDLSNNTISENISIRVDTKSPQLNFLGFPSNNSYINDSSLLYSYIGYDANGIANVEFYLNNVLQNDQNNTAIILTEGTYNLTLQAIDNTGNVTIIHSYFTVDHTAPLINIVMPNITNNGQIRIKYLANEQLSVENVSIDGIQVYSINNTLYTFNSGKHNMTIIAVDRAGNYATLTKNFIIDTNKPVINYHYDILNNNTIKLTFNATDENGISNFNVYLNSGHVNIGMNAPTIINLQNNVNNITIEAMDTANNTRIIILSFYSVSITTISLTSTTSLGNSSHTTPSARVTSISASTNVSYTGSINTTAGPELFVILCSLLILRMKKGKIKEYKK